MFWVRISSFDCAAGFLIVRIGVRPETQHFAMRSAILQARNKSLFSLQGVAVYRLVLHTGLYFVWVWFLTGGIGFAVLRSPRGPRSSFFSLWGEIRFFSEGELVLIYNPLPRNKIQRAYLFFHLVKSAVGLVAQHKRRMNPRILAAFGGIAGHSWVRTSEKAGLDAPPSRPPGADTALERPDHFCSNKVDHIENTGCHVGRHRQSRFIIRAASA